MTEAMVVDAAIFTQPSRPAPMMLLSTASRIGGRRGLAPLPAPAGDHAKRGPKG